MTLKQAKQKQLLIDRRRRLDLRQFARLLFRCALTSIGDLCPPSGITGGVKSHQAAHEQEHHHCRGDRRRRAQPPPSGQLIDSGHHHAPVVGSSCRLFDGSCTDQRGHLPARVPIAPRHPVSHDVFPSVASMCCAQCPIPMDADRLPQPRPRRPKPCTPRRTCRVEHGLWFDNNTLSRLSCAMLWSCPSPSYDKPIASCPSSFASCARMPASPSASSPRSSRSRRTPCIAWRSVAGGAMPSNSSPGPEHAEPARAASLIGWCGRPIVERAGTAYREKRSAVAGRANTEAYRAWPKPGGESPCHAAESAACADHGRGLVLGAGSGSSSQHW